MAWTTGATGEIKLRTRLNPSLFKHHQPPLPPVLPRSLLSRASRRNPRRSLRSPVARYRFHRLTMRRLLASLVLCATFAALAQAGIEFTKPKAGDTLTAGTALGVQWQEGGDGPSLSDLTTYELFLCAGGNDAGTFVSQGRACKGLTKTYTLGTAMLSFHNNFWRVLSRKPSPRHGRNWRRCRLAQKCIVRLRYLHSSHLPNITTASSEFKRWQRRAVSLRCILPAFRTKA